MKLVKTPLADCFIIEPPVFKDSRGYFSVVYNSTAFAKEIPGVKPFLVTNESFSSYGVIRGLHMQTGDAAQAKLVRVVSGRILDVAIDYRPESATYLEAFTIELSSENHKQLYVPRGFLHGFSVLSKTAIVNYQIDNLYQPEKEFGLRYDDPSFQINWEIPVADRILSEKDVELPVLKSL